MCGAALRAECLGLCALVGLRFIGRIWGAAFELEARTFPSLQGCLAGSGSGMGRREGDARGTHTYEGHRLRPAPRAPALAKPSLAQAVSARAHCHSHSQETDAAAPRRPQVLGAAYPWVARRLLTERNPELQATLKTLLYKVGRAGQPWAR